MRDSIVQLGRVISNVGTTRFFPAMKRFIGDTVAIDAMHVSIWNSDEHRGRFIDGVAVHGAELHGADMRDHLPEPLMAQILDLDGPQIIHVEARAAGAADSISPMYRCLMLMRRFNSHFIIVLQRNAERGDFQPDELTSLGDLSLVLLPLVEQHTSPQPPAPIDDTPAITAADTLLPDSSVATLSQTFLTRLEQRHITLSSREQQVCILILSGHTLPSICEELNLRASTVETYLKRARIKLGLSGRHGLSRWMIE
ncbi:helix-turn-helix transcriptional regulator [Paraburkholderia megapolitana]|jgi:DNA-binding CsgD family transcriptional regulator|uniref:Transcriptional regulator, LuxR family n=2 Tax=Paraburkholderia megapolitana TaxID=420953 RepID=A0A1I3EW63_9BURK|nr:helix-turn-helix transcriptional regulator [Paraburkholderia megapolitana]SFI03265.1 transcriptional regulator, LuxR family [Paraburkholderia megapolitana]